MLSAQFLSFEEREMGKYLLTFYLFFPGGRGKSALIEQRCLSACLAPPIIAVRCQLSS